MSTLKSEVATLVRVIGDIKRQTRRPTALKNAIGLPGAARAPKTASAIVVALIVLSGGVVGWAYFTSAAESLMVGSLPEPARAQETAFVPADHPVVPALAARATSPAPAGVAPAPAAGRAPAAGTSVNYVGTLAIDAQPGGEVFLNRERAGQTPLRLTNLRAGSHLIWIEREGYRRWTRVVEVPADRVTRLAAELEPITAR